MRSFLKDLPAVIFAAIWLSGCAEPRCAPSLVHPYAPGKPFQERSVDLSYYKPVQERAGQDANIVLTVAASGGGYRAANFTAGVLLGLEELKNQQSSSNVLSEVDYFSSVSGGGFAVSAYISTLRDYTIFNGSRDGYSFADSISENRMKCPCEHKPKEEEKTDPCARRHLAGLYDDFIGDFLRTLMPWDELGFDNRNLRFEQAIDDDALGYRWRKAKLKSLRDTNPAKNATLKLSDIFVSVNEPNRHVDLPYWFTNATVYNNSVIFPFSPDQLLDYNLTGYYHRKAEIKLKKEEPESFVMDVPISAGVTSSANFPLAMPTLRFRSSMDPNNPYFNLIDGGVADNLGIITAARLMFDKTSMSKPRKVVLVVDSYQGEFSPFEKAKGPPGGPDMAIHIMGMGLDSWRARYREFADRLNEESNIKVIYMNFDDLVDTDFNELYPFGLTEKDRKELCENKPKDCPCATPFYILRSISMNSPAFWGKHGLEYRLQKSQQDLLIAAGRYVVDKKKKEILDALEW